MISKLFRISAAIGKGQAEAPTTNLADRRTTSQTEEAVQTGLSPFLLSNLGEFIFLKLKRM